MNEQLKKAPFKYGENQAVRYNTRFTHSDNERLNRLCEFWGCSRNEALRTCMRLAEAWVLKQ